MMRPILINDLPREGSKVRLVRLKNPDLNGQCGTISGYSQCGERVMVSLDSGPQGLVKVKPKQIVLIEDTQSAASKGGHLNSRSFASDGGHHRSSLRSHQRNNNLSDNMSQSSGMTISYLKEALRHADLHFDKADSSGDGYVSEAEFGKYMKQHTIHPDSLITELFHMIDKNNDGMISHDEVKEAFQKTKRQRKSSGLNASLKSANDGEIPKKLVIDLTEHELLECSRDADQLFDTADVSGDGAISKKEFELYMKRHTKHADMTIRQLFNMMDEDNDGSITREEVHRVFLVHKRKALRENTLNRENSFMSHGWNDDKSHMGNISMGEVLGLQDDEMHELSDDVYNMFFLSAFGGQAFWYFIFIFAIKISLYVVISIDLYTNKVFPDEDDISNLTRATQVLLLPVAVAIEEELITTFFVYSNLKWSPGILELNQEATKCKYHLANAARFVDGLLFLFVNTTLLLQATETLSMVLNLEALQFIQTIDNIALHLARDGYLTDRLQDIANDVLLMKLPRNHNSFLQRLDTALVVATFISLLSIWVCVTFVW